MNIFEILNITKGSLINKIDLNTKINQFKINSEEINQNDCFIAINNGYKYIEKAIKNKAGLIITNKKTKYNIPTILVQNPIKTLGKLAKYIRQKYNPKVIAITGSIGKTTTRELLYKILSTKYKCHQNKKNYNNQIGVPITLFELKKEDQIAIIELGMNHLNEIKYLSKMITPDIAVITNIGTSHIGNLKSKKNILKAKLEIKEGLKGPLFVNGDDELLNIKNTIKSGFNKNNNLIAYNLSSNLYTSAFNINIKEKTYQIKTNLPENLINNVLIAINVGLYLNIKIEDIIESLKNFQSYSMRMNIIQTKNQNTIINDCYNSSLESLKSVLKIIQKENQKKLLILGDINELGEFSNQIHQKIPTFLNPITNKEIILIGKEMKKIKYPKAKHFNNYQKAIEYLKTLQIKNTLILIKASRSLKLENITKYLINH